MAVAMLAGPPKQTPTRDELWAQHEAGHVVVAHALGAYVVRVTIEPPQPHCHWEGNDPLWPRPGDPPLIEACRHRGAIAAAGAAAEMLIRREPTALSPTDAATFLDYQRLSPETADAFFTSCTTLAGDVLEKHGRAYWVIVTALLAKRVLQRAEILALWRSAA